MRTFWLMLPLSIVLLAGCREQSENSSDQADNNSTAPPVRVESANEFAARAQAAMDGREFAKAGELYQRAIGVAGKDATADFRNKGSLAWWLAGKLDKAAGCWDKGSPGAIIGAMKAYVEAGWPTDDPDRMLDVLPMAAAIEAVGSPSSILIPDIGSVDGMPDSHGELTWQQAARLPAILAAWAAIDSGRPHISDYSIVATIASSEKGLSNPATLTDSDPMPFSEKGLSRTPYKTTFAVKWSEHRYNNWFLQTPVVRGDSSGSSLIGDWIGWIGRHADRWPRCFLVIAVRGKDHQPGRGVVHKVRLTIGPRRLWQGHGANDPATAQDDFSRVLWQGAFGGTLKYEVEPLLTAIKIIESATPSGATPVATRGQGEMVIAALARLTGRPGLARIQPQDNYFWVMPSAGSKSADSSLIPLVAGWLAYHDWKPPSVASATSQPAASHPDDPGDIPLADPTEP